MAITVRADAPDFLGTTYGIDSASAVVDMRPKIAQLEPNEAPFVTLMMHPDFPSRKAHSVKCEWLEHEQLPVVSLTNTNDSGTGTATSVVVTTGTGVYFRPNDLVRVETTGELVLVTAVNTGTDTLTVVRGIGASGTGVDWGSTDGITLLKVGNASAQGATMPEIRSVNKVALFNYTWIQRDPFGMVRSAAMTKQYGGDPEKIERKSTALSHKRSIEHMLFAGKRDLRQTGSRPQTFAGGLLYYINANITTGGGNLTAANLETYSRDIFRYGSNRKFAFVSPLFFSAMSSFSIGKTSLSTWDEGRKYGVSAKKFVTGSGDELILVNKKNWHELPKASPGFGGMAVILDLDGGDVCLRELLSSTLFENRHARDYDGFKHEYIAELSLEVMHGGTGGSGLGKHAIIRGVTGYA
jgi:hypothetical protein